MARLADITKIGSMRKELEDRMLSSTVEDFKNFILKNGTVEEDEDEWASFIPKGEKNFVDGKTYELKCYDGGSNEFIVTTEGRVFLAYTTLQNIEVI